MLLHTGEACKLTGHHGLTRGLAQRKDVVTFEKLFGRILIEFEAEVEVDALRHVIGINANRVFPSRE